MKAIYWILLAFLLIQCQEEEVSIFEGQQIQRLLTGGDEKIWVLSSRSEDGVESTLSCTDSLRLLMTDEDDSVNIQQLIPTCLGTALTFDSLDLGNALVSSQDDLFTDSLLFEDGTFWLVEDVSSQFMLLTVGETRLRFSN